jgi:hypothetical protein
MIYGYLPVASQICLGQTCLPMHSSLENTSHRLPGEERLNFIALIARDIPDCWVAESRPWIRPLQDSDLTVIPNGPPALGSRSWNRPRIQHFLLGALMVEHKHVQLSIKYSQPENKTDAQLEHLTNLMRSYQTLFVPLFYVHRRPHTGEMGHFQWCPKVVNGRYLTFSQRRFPNETGERVTWANLGRFGSCSHQYTYPMKYIEFLLRKEDMDQARHHRECHQRNMFGRKCSYKFSVCLQDAFDSPGTWFDGACCACLSEFSICLTSEGLMVRTWKDFGGTDSPSNRVWREHTCGHGGWYPNRDPREIRSRYQIGAREE